MGWLVITGAANRLTAGGDVTHPCSVLGNAIPGHMMLRISKGVPYGPDNPFAIDKDVAGI